MVNTVYQVLSTFGLSDNTIALLLPNGWPAVIGKQPAREAECVICHSKPVTSLVHAGEWWYLCCEWCGGRAERIGFKVYRPNIMTGSRNGKKAR